MIKVGCAIVEEFGGQWFRYFTKNLYFIVLSDLGSAKGGQKG